MSPIIFLSVIVFFLGLHFYLTKYQPNYKEGLTGYRCPNLLVQKGSRFYLYNKNLEEVPGVNPIVFENLEEYVEFLDWQKSQSIKCPVLYLQETYDAQGEKVFKTRASVTEPQGGILPNNGTKQNIIKETELDEEIRYYTPQSPTLLVDATIDDPPYNINSYPAHDQTDYYIGRDTPLDDLDRIEQSKKRSPNPMDPNWGGAEYTEDLVNKGFYKNNTVGIYVNK
jgi:hypothetical protein